MILLIDNYDSFVHNLARYFERLGQATQIVRNDSIDPAGVRQLKPDAVVISPGPCSPNEAGCSLQVVRELAGEMPMLGVCLGHQTIAAAFGARIVRATAPMHGQADELHHNGCGIFTDVPNPLKIGRYHSLMVHPSTVPRELEVMATVADGTIMSVAHRRLPIVGLQFHPESILTDSGFKLLSQFLKMAGVPVVVDPPTTASERPLPTSPFLPPSRPVTF